MKKLPQLGFTFIELMIAATLASFTGAAIYKIVRSQTQNASSQVTASQNLRNSQRIRVLLSDDLSQSGFDPRYVDLARTQLTPLTSASNSSFSTQGDFNLNGTVANESGQDPETVTYTFDGSSNQVTRNGNPVLTGVQSFSVTYFDANGSSATSVPNATITALNKIKKVRVQWTQGSLQEEITTSLRNYK